MLFRSFASPTPPQSEWSKWSTGCGGALVEIRPTYQVLCRYYTRSIKKIHPEAQSMPIGPILTSEIIVSRWRLSRYFYYILIMTQTNFAHYIYQIQLIKSREVQRGRYCQNREALIIAIRLFGACSFLL